MMKDEKLNLSELKVQSFITSLIETTDGTKQIRGLGPDHEIPPADTQDILCQETLTGQLFAVDACHNSNNSCGTGIGLHCGDYI